jgi:hypothetical protein
MNIETIKVSSGRLLMLPLVLAALAAGAQTVTVSQPPTTVRWHDVSIDDYRLHLVALSSLVDACSKARSVKACDPALIGPDDRVPVIIGSQSERRMIRYGWLRVLFSKAEDPDEKAPPASKGNPKPGARNEEQPPTSDLLKVARARLAGDLAQLNSPLSPAPDNAAERAAMQQVLARPEFRNLKQQSVSDSVLEKFGKWLNRLFESAANLKAHSAWVGRALVWGFILAICVALVYFLLRLERRWRVKLTPDLDGPVPGAASARDWQLWLEDARRAAAAGQWREAIHFVYWASISRLESRRLWPADRARTPREYLALVAPEDPRRPGLSQLTSAFERFWYGGRPAAESDYRKAETLASSLISGATHAGSASLSAAPEGGAR